jgi:hypothetical protein
MSGCGVLQGLLYGVIRACNLLPADDQEFVSVLPEQLFPMGIEELSFCFESSQL